MVPRLAAREGVDLALSVAELELLHARQLAWLVPTVASFDLHSRIGLAIGAAGRRLRLLLESAGEGLLDQPAPAPPEEWEEWLPNARLGGNQANNTLPMDYGELIDWLEQLGLAVYDLVTVLRCCQSMQAATPVVQANPLGHLSGAEQAQTLVHLSGMRKERTLTTAMRRRRGPQEHQSDPRWQRLPPGASLPRVKPIEDREGLLHKLHHTAFRETVALELAAINLYEYDGLPWRFYLDMARQAEDEARHALLCMEWLQKMGGTVGQFPLPYLGNFYHMFWEMTLTERLVAMNLDTESVGEGDLDDIQHRLWRSGHEELGNVFDYIAMDEQRHARLGARWFQFLYPLPSNRKEALEAARALTVVNLASAHSQAVGGRISDILDDWIAGTAPIRYDDEADGEYEHEVSLVAARRGDRKLGVR